ncbi:MAG: hypothetical protein ABC612_08330, partial [Candidatus Methanosuratincola petrocarbonis]
MEKSYEINIKNELIDINILVKKMVDNVCKYISIYNEMKHLKVYTEKNDDYDSKNQGSTITKIYIQNKYGSIENANLELIKAKNSISKKQKELNDKLDLLLKEIEEGKICKQCEGTGVIKKPIILREDGLTYNKTEKTSCKSCGGKGRFFFLENEKECLRIFVETLKLYNL